MLDPCVEPHDNSDGLFRYLNVQEARAMLVKTLRWREHFGVAAAMKEEFPEELFGQLGRLFGRDKGGRPVMCVSDSHSQESTLLRTWVSLTGQVQHLRRTPRSPCRFRGCSAIPAVPSHQSISPDMLI